MTEVVVAVAAEKDLAGVVKTFAAVVVDHHPVVEAFVEVVVVVEERDVAGVVKAVAGVDYRSEVVAFVYAVGALVEAVVAVVAFVTGKQLKVGL